MHGVYDAIDAEDVAVVLVDGAVAHEDAVGDVGVLHDELAVVHVGQGNLDVVRGGCGYGQVAYLVFAVVVAAVDDAVEDDDLCDGVAFVLAWEGVPTGLRDESGVAERVEVLLDGFVGWGEDGVVSASREELADGRIAYLRHSRLAEQPEVFAVLLVFAQVACYGFLFEDIASRGVNLFGASSHYQRDNGENV